MKQEDAENIYNWYTQVFANDSRSPLHANIILSHCYIMRRSSGGRRPRAWAARGWKGHLGELGQWFGNISIF